MITLVLGGTRSGKSAVAEGIAGSNGEAVTYLATASVDPSDVDHGARVAAHQASRPEGWITVECGTGGDLVRELSDAEGVVLVDSLGTWVTQHRDFAVDSAPFLEALAERAQPTVVVSEEVGLAIHPPTEVGRRYVDAMGVLNQRVAQVADRVLLVVAGRVIELSDLQ